jgi:hypothetical protein
MAQQGNFPVPFAGGVTVGSGNRNGQIFPSASRTAAAYNSEPIINSGARGVRLFVANDAAGGSTAVAKIQVQDPLSGVWVDLTGATSGTVNSSTGTIVTIYPGLTGIADATLNINQHLGPIWRVVLTIGTATGVSSVGAVYLI